MHDSVAIRSLLDDRLEAMGLPGEFEESTTTNDHTTTDDKTTEEKDHGTTRPQDQGSQR